MSKRHNTSRRRAYGRRQHELHERLERRDRSRDRAWRLASEPELEALAFVDGRAASQAFGFSD